MLIAMIKGKSFFAFILLVVILSSCEKDKFDEYARPDWLTGKVYTQIKEIDSLQTFTKCLELTGYDQVINVSGSYTIFAPSNEAFDLYFSSHKLYKKIEDIPLPELTELVKYHIVQNPWSLKQLRYLDVEGWIDPENEYNNKPRGYKRETLLLKKDSKYGIISDKENKDEVMIVDTTESDWSRRVASDSRKYAPIFYKEYFDIYNLNLSDYSYYFNRNFDDLNDMYYVNAKIIGDEHFAENGFIYKIDRVVEPLLNANEILRSDKDEYNYSKFLDLVNQFPNFNYNESRTLDQEGAEQGLVVDSLFDLSYPQLTFNINSEKTKAPNNGAGLPEEVTIRFHHGLMAPTNEAFDEFVHQYIEGDKQWGSIELMPQRIKRVIANTYFSINPIYETDLIDGFYNGELDIVKLNESDINQKIYGSNCTFIGVNKAVVPRAFKSITGPVYRQSIYSTMMNAIEFSGLLPALKREGEGHMLFTVPDAQLRADSSLFYNYSNRNGFISESFNAIQLFPSLKNYSFDRNEIRLLILNQVTVESPNGIARKEFLKTLAGNHIIWDNINGTVSGTTPSTFGYNGSQQVNVIPKQISTDTDNGETYSVNAWFSFLSEEIYAKIQYDYPAFHMLLDKAGYALGKEYRYSFISENKLYTIFAPSDEALAEIQADTLTGKNLENFVKLHFIQDEMIFTDGKILPGYYKTACTLPIQGTSRKENVSIYIEPGIDVISIKGKNGNDFTSIEESENTNQITARNLSANETPDFPNIISTAVIHQTEKAFMIDLLDTK